MSKNMKQKKNKNIPHTHSGNILVGGHRGGDKKFLAGNAKVLKKLLHNFSKKT